MLSETSFQIQPIPRALFLVGGLSKLPKHVAGVRAKRAFIVSDPGVAKAGIVAKAREALSSAGLDVCTFEGVSPNPTTKECRAGADVLKEFGDAAVVAIGGGSAMDAAKAIALMAPNDASAQGVWPGAKLAMPGHKVIAIPTTAGTGSETNMYGVITDGDVGRKFLVGNMTVMPASVILDPQLTVGLPKVPTATCGMDVLTHAIEAYTSARTNPFTQGVAFRAIQMVAGYLEKAFADGSDIEARSQMLVAAHLAGDAFGSSGLGICHAMGHPLSARLGATHGQSLCTLLPAIMRFNMPVSEHQYAEVASALGVADAAGSDESNAAAAVKEVERLRTAVSTDRSLTDLGGDGELVATLVEDALADPLMMTTPRMPTPDDVAGLYRGVL